MAVTQTQAEQKTESIIITLDVGGTIHRTTTTTLKTLPNTRLGKIAQEAEKDGKNVELFFDRNPQIMNCLLDLYRTGKLHLPGHMCSAAAAEELEFWEVPTKLIQDCCWKRLESHQTDQVVISEIDNFLHDPYSEFVTKQPLTWRTKIWMLLERPDYSTASKIWSAVFCIFILLSVLTFIFESVRGFRSYRSEFKARIPVNNLTRQMEGSLIGPQKMLAVTMPDQWLLCLRYSTFVFFVLDFFIRFLICPAKKRFFGQSQNWLEIFIVIQSSVFFVAEQVMVPEAIEDGSITSQQEFLFSLLIALSGARALRILYIAKNFDSMKILLLCAKSSLKELLLLVTCVISFVTLFGTITYMAEIFDNLNTFPSIALAMWWAIVTMTTVGYGDVYPVSTGGKLVGALCALSGVIVIALPVAVIASKFSVYHDNLSPRQQRRARASFLKENPEFDLGKEFEGQEGQGHGADSRCVGEGRSRKRNSWGASRSSVVSPISMDEDKLNSKQKY